MWLAAAAWYQARALVSFLLAKGAIGPVHLAEIG